MNNEDIIAVIKWGPLALFLIIFLFSMIVGLIRGRRKVTRRFIYVVLFILASFFFTPMITKFALTIEINGVGFESFIANNETISNLTHNIPGLAKIIEVYPSAIASLVVFILLVLVILPLSFPLYWIYCLIYNPIYKRIFKYSKYQRDENGKVIRNEKGKKIKIKHDKHRLSSGLIKGVEGVLVSSVIFVPVGVVTRLYQDAKETSEKHDLSNIEYLANMKDILKYLDAFNDSFVGKITNSDISKGIVGYLSPIHIDGNKSTLEKELSSVVVAAIYVQESGLIELLSNGVDIQTLDLSKVKIDKIEKAIESLFNSVTLNTVVADGVNYVLENNLKETIVSFSSDKDIISKIKYSNSQEVKQEILRVTSVLKDIINAKLLESYQSNKDNLIGVVNEVKVNEVEGILNKVLSIKILSETMPGVMSKVLKDYGLVSELAKEDNNDFVKVLLDLIKLVQTLEITNLEQISEGNIVTNIVNLLYKDGTLKDNSIDSLATLLSNINSARVFDEVLVEQLNKILDSYEIKLNSKMITNVKTKAEWKQELLVVENICKLYDLYDKENKVDFLEATKLLENFKNSKAMILALPVAYQKLFPQIGIEIDLNKIEYIDYSKEDASEKELEFYSYWKGQVIHLENIADEMARLEITSLSDVSLDLLEMEGNVISLSNILAEVFTSDMLKDGVSKLVNDTMKDLLLEYDVKLNDNAIDSVNNTVVTNPYYIIENTDQYDIVKSGDKYYIDETEVTIVDNKINYNSKEYEIIDNSLNRIWKKELMNLSNIMESVKTGNYTEKETLASILNSVDNMVLLKDVKTDLLIFAIREINVLEKDYIDGLDKTKINFTKEKNILLDIIEEYEVLKDMGDIDFATIEDSKITTLSNVLSQVLSSDIFGDYAADTIVDLAKKENITLDSESVKASTTWESDLKLIRTALNMDKDDFNETKVTQLLSDIKSSGLLGPIKEEILLNTAKQIEMEGIEISEDLKPSDIDYDKESLAIISASRNLNLIENLADKDVMDMETEAISDLLANTINSKLFGDSVVEKLVTVFNEEGIKHDFDIGEDNTTLITTIKSINTKEKWEDEFTIIKSLLEVKTKDDVNQEIFDTLENDSVLLGGCRANLMIRMVNEIKKSDGTLDLSSVSVETLVGQDKKYTQYKQEKLFLVKLTNLTSIDDISDIDEGNKTKIAQALNAMKASVIFDKEYKSLLTDMTKPIKEIEVEEGKTLTSWGITVDSNPSDIDWENELTALLTINKNMAIVAGYNAEQAKANTKIIGDTLEAMDDSMIIGGSDVVAGNLVHNLVPTIPNTPITKDTNTSWESIFTEVLKYV